MEVRNLDDADRARWSPLWRGYLDFYDHQLDDATTEWTWRRLAGDDPSVVGFGAFTNDELIGICHLVLHPSTWSRTSYCYLEDLFVVPDRRGGGVGRALIEAAEAEAQRQGATKLYWQTHVTNTTARRLYDQVALHEGFIVYEVELGA